MATVIDSLIVTLGLDATQFTKQQKEAAGALLKTKNEATSAGKAIEEAGKQASDALHKIAIEALAMFAVFTGSSSLKNFVNDLISANAELGRFSTRIGASPQTIQAWENAAERVGGTAEATAGSFQKIADSLNALHTQGQNLPLAFYQLMAAANKPIDTEHGPVKFMQDLATAAGVLAQQDPAKAAYFLKAIGIDEGTINLMISGGPALNSYIESLKKLSPTPEQIKASQELSAAWVTLQQTASSLGNTVLPTLNAILTPALASWSQWIDKNRELINSKVEEVLLAVKNAINGIDWPAITQGMGTFASAADSTASAINTIAAGLKTISDYSDSFNKFMQAAQNPFGLKKGETIFEHMGIGAPQSDGNKPNDGSMIGRRGKFGGGKAVGGGVSPGGVYLVGERGPELLSLGGQGGNITPNNALGGDLSVDGRTVNKTNPVPVELTGGGGGGENWLQTLGRWFTGGSSGGGGGGSGGGIGGFIGGIVKAVSGGGSADGGPYNPVIGKPGTYRPQYGLGSRDLSDAVVNTINGEATGTQQSTDAVINNMFNRLGTHTYGPSGDLQAVARARGQYAGYRVANAARAAMIRERIKAIASGTVPDNTNGSNEYRAGWYNGPWGRKHADSPVVGGNRFAYNPKGGKGPFAPYEHPNVGFAGGAQFAAQYHNSSNDNRRSSSNSVSVGAIHINAEGKDARGIGDEVSKAMNRLRAGAVTNTGVM